MLTKIENTKHTRENIFLHESARDTIQETFIQSMKIIVEPSSRGLLISFFSLQNRSREKVARKRENRQNDPTLHRIERRSVIRIQHKLVVLHHRHFYTSFLICMVLGLVVPYKKVLHMKLRKKFDNFLTFRLPQEATTNMIFKDSFRTDDVLELVEVKKIKKVRLAPS